MEPITIGIFQRILDEIDFNNTFEPDSIDPVTEVPPETETIIPPLEEPITEETSAPEPPTSTEELLLSKLDSIPVFAIADQDGTPLVATGDDGRKTTGIFISQSDANEFVVQLEANNPELAAQVSVVPQALDNVYSLAESVQGEEEALNFAYVPEDEAVADATSAAVTEPEAYEGGVPLFTIVNADSGSFLTVDQENDSIIPFFFELEQAESLVATVQEREPDLAANIAIQVVPLEGVIETFETSDNELLEQIVLVPTQESQDFIESSDDGRENVYRFFNQNTGVHFYTASEAERDNIVDNLPNFNSEGVSYKVVDSLTGAENTDVVHRFLNQDTEVHIYTIDENERSFIAENFDNYIYEGEVFAAYTSQVEGTIPIYRFYNSLSNTHFYTPSETERESIENSLPDYYYEGIAYYAFPADV